MRIFILARVYLLRHPDESRDPASYFWVLALVAEKEEKFEHNFTTRGWNPLLPSFWGAEAPCCLLSGGLKPLVAFFLGGLNPLLPKGGRNEEESNANLYPREGLPSSSSRRKSGPLPSSRRKSGPRPLFLALSGCRFATAWRVFDTSESASSFWFLQLRFASCRMTAGSAGHNFLSNNPPLFNHFWGGKVN